MKNIDPKIIEWFANRGISEQTLKDLNVSSGINWMPPTQILRTPNGGNTYTVHYQYFFDGVLVYTKLRSIYDKCFRIHPVDRTKAAHVLMIPYNIDSIKDSETCYITEGEIDAISLHEVGFKNVISVPHGPDYNTKWIDTCFYTHLKNKSRFIICADMDERGLLFANKLRDDLYDRLNYDITDICAEYGVDPKTGRPIKDPNECLVKLGREALYNHVLNFIP